jgi:Flp pilus assembly protein CpaB
VVGNWDVKKSGSDSEAHHISRVVLRNLLVLRAPTGTSSGGTVTAPGSGQESIQLRLTDSQSQKLMWIQQNGDYWLELRPPANSLDSANTIQEVDTMFFDGPGRRP